ncbi:50S ribosomal protein L21 [Sphingomonas segetis]|jgi:large subunit ribosomal protein L21|uniref:50S ribosomal protein L21 n=1 Tax=Sphingomonas segetis TaxID=1104779 RepID=UPI0012D2C94E|nr:50S ribosomal protein L21 [Sphingomonas segetis]
MFAVVRTGGKQYRVHPGDKIVVEKLDGNAGDKVTLGDVLLAGDAGKLESTDGLKVAAEIIAQAKGEKVTVFKKRRRHNYRRKKGHRQQHTILKIVAIGDHKSEKPAKAAKSNAAPAPEAAAKPAKGSAKKVDTAPAEVDATPTENPAPNNEAQANPPAESVDAPPKAAKDKPADKPTAKTRSTKNAAPAKGGAKKAPKAK